MVGTLGIAAAATTATADEDVPAADATRESVVTIENRDGWTLDAIVNDSAAADIYGEVVLTIPTSTTEITVGVLPEPGDTAADIEAEVDAVLAEMSAPDPNAAPATLKQYRSAANARASERRVVRATLHEGRAVPAGLAKYAVAAEPAAAEVASLAADVEFLAAAAADCDGTWHPNYFKITAQPSAAGGRYGRLYFQWSTTSRLNNLKDCADVTFEPDFVTYNYDDKHYLGTSISSWSSNMPNAYLDTSFGDNADELVYTVGTSKASALMALTEYTTYFRAPIGNAGSDTMKVLAQRGHRVPSVCYSTWCIFAVESVRYPSSGWVGIPTTNLEIYK